MWRFIVNLFAIVGLLALVVAGALGFAAWRLMAGDDTGDPLGPNAMLEVELDGGLPFAPDGGFGLPLGGAGRATLAETARAIEDAAADPRITALVARLDGTPLDFSAAQSLRSAVEAWSQAGKPTLVFADSFGMGGAGNAAYYLASAFDEIWLRPEGQVALTGIRIEVPFAREALDGLDIEPEFVRAGEFKTFPETFTETQFTEPHREMLGSLADDLFSQLVDGVADGRDLPPDVVRALIDEAPLLAEEAQSGGLVDDVADDTAFDDALEARLGAVDRLDAGEYLRRRDPDGAEPDARVALVHVDGAIGVGDDPGPPGIGPAMADPDEIVRAIDEAVARDEIAGILLRLNTPGGSVLGSARIAGAIDRALAADKPVVVSMGPMAASGGYWVAAGATAIVAEPATLTGSIGVFTGNAATRRFWQDLGVRWGVIERGAHAGIYSLISPYSPEEEARIQAVVDHLYRLFVARVAEGRGLDPSSVEAIAEGRVWTGGQALGLGLVDALGGQAAAEDPLREALLLPSEATLALVTLPEPLGPLAALRALSRGDLPGVQAAPALGSLLGDAAPASAGGRLGLAAGYLTALLSGGGAPQLLAPPLLVR